jgi:hypothetical protein
VGQVLADARRGHAGLFGFAVIMAVLAAVLVVLAVADQRSVLGAPLWFKPLKFAISLAVYAGALAWMLGQLPGPALQRTGWVIVVSSAAEIVIITAQAGRGVRSHFNDDSAVSAGLYSVMGLSIGVLYVATLVIAARFLREPGSDPAIGTAIRLGLGVSIAGLSVGFLMVAANAHAVGVPDGGPGLLFTGWSTTGGDLRIGHFAGMHALQVLPLLAAALQVLAGDRLDVITRQRVVIAVAAGYLAVVLLLVWQALRAQPITRPDALTLTAAAVIVLATAAGLALALRGPGSAHVQGGPGPAEPAALSSERLGPASSERS